MTARILTVEAYAALKTATRITLRAFGGAEAASGFIGVRTGESLRNYQDPGFDRYVPVDVVVDLESGTQYPHITAALAGAAGYVLVPGPDRLGEGAASKALAEAGEAVTAIATTYADGRCDHTEAGPARKEIRESIIALLELDAKIASEHPHTGPALLGRKS